MRNAAARVSLERSALRRAPVDGPALEAVVQISLSHGPCVSPANERTMRWIARFRYSCSRRLSWPARRRHVSARARRPLQRRSRQMLETILQATTRVLIQEGYTSTTTNRVAEVAGISVGSLYQYFPSKDALVVALLRRAPRGHGAGAGVRTWTGPSPRRRQSRPRCARWSARCSKRTGSTRNCHRVMIEQVLRKDAPRGGRRLRAPGSSSFLRRRSTGPGIACASATSTSRPFILVRMVLGVAHAAVVDHPERARDPRLAHELGDVVLRYLLE